MSSQRKKHLMLKALYKHYITIPEHYYEGSKGMYIEDFNLKFDLGNKNELIASLLLNDLIIKDKHYINNKETYYITKQGKTIYLDKVFISELWYKSRSFVISLSAVVISLGALGVSILSFLYK